MTDNRTTLLPCPFCGGEVEMLTAESMNGGYLFGIMCNDCRSRGDVYDTEAEVIAAWNSRADYHGYEQAAIEAWKSIKAWNSRAERTCKFDYEQAAEYWQRMYEQTFAERTCHDTGENEWHFVCSVCGYEQNGYECWNYCPSCGCKVVGE